MHPVPEQGFSSGSFLRTDKQKNKYTIMKILTTYDIITLKSVNP